MSIFHFKAVLKEQRDDGLYLYFFYPDFIAAPRVQGVFLVNPEDWQPSIVTPARAEEIGLVSTDERCVSGLTAKIKKYYESEGKMPTEVIRIS